MVEAIGNIHDNPEMMEGEQMSYFNISVMAHNDAICRRAEDAINSMIDMIRENGGQIWIQSKNNKEHYYTLTDHISLNYYVPIPDDAVQVEISDIHALCKEDGIEKPYFGYAKRHNYIRREEG